MDDYGDGDSPPSPIKITAMNDDGDDGPLPPMPPGKALGAVNTVLARYTQSVYTLMRRSKPKDSCLLFQFFCWLVGNQAVVVGLMMPMKITITTMGAP